MTSDKANKDMREAIQKDIKAQTQKAFRREAGLRRFIFVLLMVILTIVSAYFGSLSGQFQIYLQGIAVSLLTSLIFTLFYIIVVEAALKNAESEAFSIEMGQLEGHVQSSLDEALERRLSPLLGEKAIRLVEHWKQLLPINYFAPSKDPNPEFQDALRKGVSETRTYIFRGGTAKYVASLLQGHGNPNRLTTCQILILDPRTNAIKVHALDRVRAGHREDRPESSLQETEERIRHEIYDAIVELFALRERFKIELETCGDSLFYRSEIVDSGAFVSYYTDDRLASFPPTYLYERDTFYYKTFLKDFQQSWEYPTARFVISPSTSESELQAFLDTLEGSGA